MRGIDTHVRNIREECVAGKGILEREMTAKNIEG